MQTLESLDWISIAVYFTLLAGIAIWVIKNKKNNTEDYFLAGRNVGWFVVGASIFASNIGSEHVVGLAGAGASDKLPMLIYEIHAWIVLILGWVFLPFYQRAGVFTMPEFLEKRFDSRLRWILSVFSIVAYVLTKISVTIYAGGIVVSALLGIDFWTGAIATVILTGLYTVLGGMRAVVYTETLQALVLIVGAGVLTYIGLDRVGGWESMKATVTPEYLNMWRPATDPDFPWPSLFISSTIVGIWYWCTDQYIVQRTLTAKNIKEGRRGTIFGALMKLLPVFLFLIPGVIALTLKMRGELHWDSPDEAFPVLMSNLLPAGLRGLVAAGLLAALMSSLASVFNSVSTLFTVDIYKKLRPETHEKKISTNGTDCNLSCCIDWYFVDSHYEQYFRCSLRIPSIRPNLYCTSHSRCFRDGNCTQTNQCSRSLHHPYCWFYYRIWQDFFRNYERFIHPREYFIQLGYDELPHLWSMVFPVLYPNPNWGKSSYRETS